MCNRPSRVCEYRIFRFLFSHLSPTFRDGDSQENNKRAKRKTLKKWKTPAFAVQFDVMETSC